ncbi:Protein NPC2-like protein [Armadillidium vulgare]|nr:Protein NPC2-like protein [Armadillidium vulgare]
MNNIKITGCSPNKNDCVFARGEDAEIQIPFTTSNSPEKLTAIVHGILFGIPIPFSLPNNDACVDSGLSCPVPKNTEVIYTTKIPVRKEYPSLRVTVQMKLRDENGDDVTCIKFPVRLV